MKQIKQNVDYIFRKENAIGLNVLAWTFFI